MTVLIDDFPDIDAIREVLERRHPARSGTSSRDAFPSESWDLELGYPGSERALYGGWSEGGKKAYDLAERLRPNPIAPRTTLERHVTGAFPNVGAHLAGAPNAMYRVTKRQTQAKPYVHLYMPVGFTAAVGADTAFDRGCALVAIADALETAGCRVKITLTRLTQIGGGRDQYLMRWVVKDYGDRLDVDNLIFQAAHPAFFRRIGFAIQERSDHWQARRASAGGYGHSNIELVPGKHTEDDGRAVTVCFPVLTPRVAQPTPEAYLRKMVAALPEDIQTTIEGE